MEQNNFAPLFFHDDLGRASPYAALSNYYYYNGNGINFSTSPVTAYDPATEGSGSTSVDNILYRYKWGQASFGSDVSEATQLTYSFSVSGVSVFSYGNPSPASLMQTFPANQTVAAEYAMQSWANVANIRFTQTADTSTSAGDIRWVLTQDSAVPTAQAYYPGVSGAGGDIWFGPNMSQYGDLTPGAYGGFTYLHELGHALGLMHPHDSSIPPVSGEDQLAYSVMSYRDFAGDSLNSYSTAVFPSTPMLNDIAAIQWLYGANMSYHVGDDVYAWAPGAAIYETIWDAGGSDTIDASNQLAGVEISLVNGQWSKIGGVFWDGQGYVQGKLSIAYGAMIENVVGTQFNDTIVGNELDNLLNGGAGDDTFIIGSGNDQIDGGAGTDTVIYSGGTEGRVISLNSPASSLEGIENSDTLISVENVIGTNFSDTISGNDQANDLRGLDGNDYFYEGHGGEDQLNGGNGIDTIDYSAASSQVILDLGVGSASLNGSGGRDTLIGFENATGSRFADSLTGTAEANVLHGAEGNDSLFGGAGNDVLNGGLGSDVINGGEGQDLASFEGVQSKLWIELWRGRSLSETGDSDALYSIENVTAGSGDDLVAGDWNANRLLGNSGDDRLMGFEGHDYLAGGRGVDSVEGGSGDDVYVLESDIGTQGTLVSTYAGDSEMRPPLDWVASNGWSNGGVFMNSWAASNVSHVASTGSLLLTLSQDGATGGEYASTETYHYGIYKGEILAAQGDGVVTGMFIYSGEPHDEIDIEILGKDPSKIQFNYFVNGQGGHEHVYDIGYDASLTPVDVRIEWHPGSIRWYVNNTLAHEVTSADGPLPSAPGRLMANVWAVDGAEEWAGEFMPGVSRAAEFSVLGFEADISLDSIIENAGEGSDSVLAHVSTTLADNVENLTMAGEASIAATGNSLGNWMRGNPGHNRVYGLAGNDRLEGGAGNDILDGGAGIDAADYTAATSNLNIELWRGVALDDGYGGRDTLVGIENIIGGIGHDFLAGNWQANRMEGGSGNDRIATYEGNDTLIGGAGNDRLDGGTGVDIADYSTSTSGIFAELWRGSTTNDGMGGADVLVSIENIRGSSHDDFLAGNWQANRMEGGSGNDRIATYEGNDTLIGGAGNDRLDGGTEVDIADYTAAPGNIIAELWRGNATNDGFGGTDILVSVENLYGGSGNDLLSGDFRDNRLEGRAGSDRLFGQEGNDVIIGGGGNDTISAGLGNDTIVFNLASNSSGNKDLITDFQSGSDRILLLSDVFSDAGDIGALLHNAFAIGANVSSALDADDRVVYNTSTGQVFYDQDGVGGIAAVELCTLNGAPLLQNTDITIGQI